MKFNDIKTNEVLEVTKIDPTGNSIAVLIKSVTGEIVNVAVLNPNPSFSDKYDESIIINDFVADRIEERFPDALLDTGEGDWFHSVRGLRLIVPNSLILREQKDSSDFGLIIDRLKLEDQAATEKFIFPGSKYTVVYIAEVASGDATHVQPFIATGVITLQPK